MRAHAQNNRATAAASTPAALTPFLDLFDLIGRLARRRYQVGERSFASLGLNHTEARLLTLLGEEGGKAAQDVLSNRLFVDRTNAGRALQSLEQRGYILRRKDSADKRANLVQITAKGRQAVGDIAKLRKQIAAAFFGDLQARDAKIIVNLLSKALPDEEAGTAAGSAQPVRCD